MSESNRSGRAGRAPGRERVRTPPALPAWKAFVVQFSRETGVEPGTYSGRIEHLGTGQRARFASAGELFAFVNAVLVQDAGPLRR